MSYIGKEPQYTDFLSKFFNGDGTAMTVTLDASPPNEAALLVFIDGVRQDTSAYTVSGYSLTFTGAVPSGTNNVQVVHLGIAQDTQVPVDDSVSTVKIQDDAVTSAKLDTNIAIDGDLTVDTNTLHVDSTNNRVGVGTTTPAESLNLVGTSGDVKIRFDGDSSNLQNNYIGITSYDDLVIAADESNTGTASTIQFRVDNSERMRIDSSGNLLVGKTSPATNVEGGELRENGQVLAVATDINPFFGARLGSDGDIAVFRKDGSTVGSQYAYNGDLGIGTSNVTLLFYDAGNAILPRGTLGAVRDNAIDLGESGNRFDDIYATNGTIQTSDANEKQDIEALSEAETRVAVAAKALLRKFRWRSAVEEKGDEARVHFGIIAQDLQAAFEAEGLDAGDYAMFIHSTWTDEETGEERSRMGVRYSELLAFIIAAI